MIKRFKVFQIEQKNVHVPSTDFYARNNDSQTDTINILGYGSVFDTEEEALKDIEDRFKNSSYSEDEFVILPIYSKK